MVSRWNLDPEIGSSNLSETTISPLAEWTIAPDFGSGTHCGFVGSSPTGRSYLFISNILLIFVN